MELIYQSEQAQALGLNRRIDLYHKRNGHWRFLDLTRQYKTLREAQRKELKFQNELIQARWSEPELS